MNVARHSGRPREECGICAVVGHPEAAKLAYLSLYALQHRGQEAAGIVSAERVGDRVRHRIHRGLGLVPDVFDAGALESLRGDVAIGHVRYSTMGSSTSENAQPVVSAQRHGNVALGHNGNLTNAAALRDRLQGEGAIFQTSIDSEAILHLMSRANAASAEGALLEALAQVQGAFSLVVLHENRVFAVRDARGFRPLILGLLPSGGWVLASETVAFDLIGATRVRDLDPGEVLRLVPGTEPTRVAQLPQAPRASCIFELIYFSRPDSIIDGYRVQEVRHRLGEELWREQPADAEVVIGVPDSSLPAAVGYARAAHLPFDIGMTRNHYIGRTFIEPGQGIRDFGAKVKYNPVRSAVEGRRVAVLDDSIVRGTTSRKIVRMLREAGAREVHLRITAPPWRHSCPYGIDTPDPADFVATGRTIEQIREELGADSLGFLSPEGLRRAANRREGWCTACFDGIYPVPFETIEKDHFEQKDRDLSRDAVEFVPR